MPKPNRTSVDAVEFQDLEAALAHGPGAYLTLESDTGGVDLLVIVPGETTPRYFAINTGNDWEWVWDGETLSPEVVAWSFTEAGKRYEQWRGTLSAGRLESV